MNIIKTYEKFEYDIRNNYQKFGVDNYYKTISYDYNNPHIEYIKYSINELITKYKINLNKVLDLSSGTGEITNILKYYNITNIEGCDPYLYDEYEKNTNNKCMSYSFEDIQKGILLNKKYTTIICSYAMHLCEKSILPDVLWNLSLISKFLIILSPNNKPYINENNGWILDDSFRYNKTKTRIYISINL